MERDEALTSMADSLADIKDNTNSSHSSTGEKTADILNNINYNLKSISEELANIASIMMAHK